MKNRMGANESAQRSKHKEYDDAIKCFDSEELEKWRRCFREISQESPSKKKREGFKVDQLSVSFILKLFFSFFAIAFFIIMQICKFFL